MSTVNITELSKLVKMKPMAVRSRLRRHLPVRHEKGQRWDIPRRSLPKVIKLLKEK
jgi:hypothetical protein